MLCCKPIAYSVFQYVTAFANACTKIPHQGLSRQVSSRETCAVASRTELTPVALVHVIEYRALSVSSQEQFVDCRQQLVRFDKTAQPQRPDFPAGIVEKHYGWHSRNVVFGYKF